MGEVVRWDGSDTLYLSAIQPSQRWSIGLATRPVHPPTIVYLAIGLYDLAHDLIVSPPVLRDVPVYPERAGWQFRRSVREDGSAYLSYTVGPTDPVDPKIPHAQLSTDSPTDVIAWYEQALTSSPWTITQRSRNLYGVNALVQHCILAERLEDDGTSRTFAVRIFGIRSPFEKASVTITTPASADRFCSPADATR